MTEIIFAYTRQQAIDDGVLVNVSTTATEAGFRFPVALTSAVWHDCVAVPDGCRDQDEEGRLWDILWMLKLAIKGASGKRVVEFVVLVENDERGPKEKRLKAVCGPGDNLEPVITVMLPDED